MDRFYTTDPNLKVVLRWVFSVLDCEPVDESWVPGANLNERRRLTALGGLVSALVENAEAHPAFTHADLRQWLTGGPTPPDEVVEAAAKILAEQREDGLAAIYGKVVSGKSRRTLGTFFTPASEVRWMVETWHRLHPAPDAVVDVGAGVGIFTTAAAGQWPHAGVWSVDINPVTLGLLALRVHEGFPPQSEDETGPGLRIVLGDFTQWMTKGWERLSGRRLILGNPPYTRLQLLPHEQRERLVDTAGGLCGRRASLSALITAQSLNALGPADGLALLLPAQWLESAYADDLRTHLWRLTDRRIEMRLFDQGLFDDATVDAVAFIVGPAEPTPQPVVFSTGSKAREITARDICPPEWRSLFTRAVGTASHRPAAVLGDYLKVRRGIATGANAFFVLTKEQADNAGIPESLTSPLIRRLLGLPDTITSAVLTDQPADSRHLLLTVTTRTYADVADYLESDEATEVQERHLCRKRADWYDLSHEVTHPDLVIGQATKKDFRVVENAAGAVILNNLYGMTWLPDVAAETRSELLAWLRGHAGQKALRASSRMQGTGLYKIEPKALKSLRLPPQFKLPQGTLA